MILSKEEKRGLALKEIFHFYAKQHQIAGTTFDDMRKKASQLDIGEFMKFCIEFRIPCRKELLMEIFRKTALNTKHMNYEEFLVALNNLSIKINDDRINLLYDRIKKIDNINKVPLKSKADYLNKHLRKSNEIRRGSLGIVYNFSKSPEQKINDMKKVSENNLKEIKEDSSEISKNKTKIISKDNDSISSKKSLPKETKEKDSKGIKDKKDKDDKSVITDKGKNSDKGKDKDKKSEKGKDKNEIGKDKDKEKISDKSKDKDKSVDRTKEKVKDSKKNVKESKKDLKEVKDAKDNKDKSKTPSVKSSISKDKKSSIKDKLNKDVKDKENQDEDNQQQVIESTPQDALKQEIFNEKEKTKILIGELKKKTFESLREELLVYLELDEDRNYRKKMKGFILPFSSDKNYRLPIKEKQKLKKLVDPKTADEIRRIIQKRKEDKLKQEIEKERVMKLKYLDERKKLHQMNEKKLKDHDRVQIKDGSTYVEIKQKQINFEREKSNKITWDQLESLNPEYFVTNKEDDFNPQALLGEIVYDSDEEHLNNLINKRDLTKSGGGSNRRRSTLGKSGFSNQTNTNPSNFSLSNNMSSPQNISNTERKAKEKEQQWENQKNKLLSHNDNMVKRGTEMINNKNKFK